MSSEKTPKYCDTCRFAVKDGTNDLWPIRCVNPRSRHYEERMKPQHFCHAFKPVDTKTGNLFGGEA